MESKTTKAMDLTWAKICGAMSCIGAYLMHINWGNMVTQLLSANLWTVLIVFALQVLKLGLAGIVGGACGKLGERILEKIFPNKKKRSTRSH